MHVIAYQAQAKWTESRAANLRPVANQEAQTQSWSCLPSQSFKLNTDASLMVEGNRVGLGGVVRDHRGKAMVAFSNSHHLNCWAEIAEALAICKGIRIARDNGLLSLIVESDASSVVSLINNRSLPLAEIGMIIHEIQNMLFSMPSSAVYAPDLVTKWPMH